MIAQSWELQGMVLRPVGFSDLAGFSVDRLVEVWAPFHQSCRAIKTRAPELRKGLPPTAAHRAVCERAVSLGPEPSPNSVRSFFMANFSPHVIVPNPGDDEGASAFFTAYYRPETPGSLFRTSEFSEPIFARPADLVTFTPGETPQETHGLIAARRLPDGSLAPYPTRAEIETGALGDQGRPIAYVEDAIEAFMIQVQGSARLVLSDGRKIDLTYAGRNGRPYTSIGKILVEEGHIHASEMSLDRLKAWVRENGQEVGQGGRVLLHRNQSFVFFEAAPANHAATGPVGAAGLPLTAFRSIAIDRSIWAYGLPFWVEADLPWEGAQSRRFARLVIGQDTGSAIIGAARADLFFGTGPEAGRLAGNIRHRGRMIVLIPSESPHNE